MALEKRIAVLIGGVGGAKLARGLVEVVPPQQLTFIVNTGDDFWHYGLKICPDLDTLLYTLADMVDPALGWGVGKDTTITLESLTRLYGVEGWFRLGDIDLATHLLRTELLRRDCSLTDVSGCLAERLGVRARLLPMSDDEAPTVINTVDEGQLPFQEYFVRRRWRPAVSSIQYEHAAGAALSEPVRTALLGADAVLIAPSNPWLSIAPILSVPGLRDLLAGLCVPVIAVTPIIAGAAVKGPTAKIMREMGLEVSAAAVLNFYSRIISGFVNDLRNDPLEKEGVRMLHVDSLMHNLSDKISLSQAILSWIDGWPS